MNAILQTLLGLCLIAVGIAGWFVLDHRGEMVVLALIGFGGFLVSKSQTVAFGKAVVELVKAWRS